MSFRIGVARCPVTAAITSKVTGVAGLRWSESISPEREQDRLRIVPVLGWDSSRFSGEGEAGGGRVAGAFGGEMALHEDELCGFHDGGGTELVEGALDLRADG